MIVYYGLRFARVARARSTRSYIPSSLRDETAGVSLRLKRHTIKRGRRNA